MIAPSKSLVDSFTRLQQMAARHDFSFSTTFKRINGIQQWRVDAWWIDPAAMPVAATGLDLGAALNAVILHLSSIFREVKNVA
jgi:hypothetical protein